MDFQVLGIKVQNISEGNYTQVHLRILSEKDALQVLLPDQKESNSISECASEEAKIANS